ncbi:hypothetical protein [Bauldia sp.]|uniref:hypothetical protein n=1 Tax=Bauldia sp. TaxID=2575872 RepID=UPI003BAD8604
MTMARMVTAMALTLGIGSATAQADNWAGFYVGIDQRDGSIDRISVVPTGDASYAVHVKASRFGSCDGAHPGAVINGTATVVDASLVASQRALWCTGPGGDHLDLNDVTYTLDTETGTLSFPASGRTISVQRLGPDEAGADSWAGFYIGIDPHDGSIDRKAILANDDGTYSIATKSTKFAFCETADPDAILIDTAQAVDDQLVGEAAMARCSASDEMTTRADGTYIRVADGIIALDIGSDEQPLIHFHRISKP